jgi:hypothetical protein
VSVGFFCKITAIPGGRENRYEPELLAKVNVCAAVFEFHNNREVDPTLEPYEFANGIVDATELMKAVLPVILITGVAMTVYLCQGLKISIQFFDSHPQEGDSLRVAWFLSQLKRHLGQFRRETILHLLLT